MANEHNSNSLFIDAAAAGPLGPVGSRVYSVVLSGIGGNARLTLSDTTTAAPKLDIACIQNDTVTILFPEERPLVFPTGITVNTATNAKATLILAPQR